MDTGSLLGLVTVQSVRILLECVLVIKGFEASVGAWLGSYCHAIKDEHGVCL